MTLTRQHNPYMVSDFRISLLVPLASKFLTLNTHRLCPLKCPSFYSVHLHTTQPSCSCFISRGRGGGEKKRGVWTNNCISACYRNKSPDSSHCWCTFNADWGKEWDHIKSLWHTVAVNSKTKHHHVNQRNHRRSSSNTDTPPISVGL